MSRLKKFPEKLYVGITTVNELMIIPVNLPTSELLEFYAKNPIRSTAEYRMLVAAPPQLDKKSAKSPKTAGKASGSVTVATKPPEAINHHPFDVKVPLVDFTCPVCGRVYQYGEKEAIGVRCECGKAFIAKMESKNKCWRCSECGNEFDKPHVGKKGNYCPKCLSAKIEVI